MNRSLRGVSSWWLSISICGFLVLVVGCTDTEYATGYTERAFEKVQIGMDTKDVENLLGKPLSQSPVEERWTLFYLDATRDENSPLTHTITFDLDTFLLLHLNNQGFIEVIEGSMPKDRDLHVGSTRAAAIETLGEPYRETKNATGEIWYYSRQSSKDTHYYIRDVIFGATGTVIAKRAEFYFD